ncbi:PDZ domain-containing protein [Caerostris extrusa]|uniref:PDZ domain-containing protein n=1 Tax=Caerostris extrusa TaxID=172846 RepID=A0AAV4WKE9_CAEEX|nr:PDZ domain-containing protein [Caerostris extrusa]
MAFQRPFLISLKRSDSSNRWGFGIKGGSDYQEPLRIQSVIEDSLAEKSGLREGDEVIQVGRVNVQDLTLGQVHELLARCGNKLKCLSSGEDFRFFPISNCTC